MAGSGRELSPSPVLYVNRARVQDFAIPTVGKVFLVAGAAESLALLSIACLTLYHSHTHSEPEEVDYIALLSIYVIIGFLYFAWDSIASENVFQFW